MPNANEYMENLESVARLIGDLALNIADAQDRLDVAYVKNLSAFAKVMANAAENKQLDGGQLARLFKSMAPSRYQFTETVVETRADLQMSDMKQFSGGVSVGYATPVFAAAVNASYVKRSAYDYRASASIRTVIQAVTPDASLMATLMKRASEITSPTLPADSRYKALADAFKELAPAEVPTLPAPANPAPDANGD